MNKLAAITLFLGILAFSAFGQGTSTRPRVTTTPTPPQIQNDPYSNQQQTQSGPPTLVNPNARTTPTPGVPPVAGDDEVIKVETNLVTMPVSILDRDGRFIGGLQQRDFKVFENGVEQKLDYFQSVEQPFTVIMLIDVSPSTQFRIEEIQNAAMTFVDQLRPSDRVMVVAFDERIHVLSPVTNNRNLLKNAIRQTQFGDGTSLYEAVQSTIENQLRQIQGRKAVVLFTDGVDTTSPRQAYQTTIRESEEVDAMFYTLRYDTSRDMNGGWGGGGNGGYGGGGGRRRGGGGWGSILGTIITGGNVQIGNGRNPGGAGANEYETGKRYLETLSQNSGGRSFEAQTMYNVESAFSGIAEELRQQYSIGYYPDKVGTVGERRQIKIRVMRPNVVVRAKTSYIVGQTNRSVAGK
jgi:Ca-activated chloride channel family protein